MSFYTEVLQKDPRFNSPAACHDLSHKYLKEIIFYEPITGKWTWLISPNPKKPWLVGQIAGTIASIGYRHIQINGKLYKSSRLAIFYMTGEWPTNEIDHINGIKDDDKFYNLREATHQQNGCNVKMKKNNTSNFKNVSWVKRIKKWRSYINVNGKQTHIGYFDCPVAAYLSYVISADKLHGEFARII